MARLGHLVLLGAIVSLFVACTQSHAVGLEIVGAPADGSLRALTIRVYRSSVCPSIEDVANDADGAFERVYAQTAAAGATMPPVGRLDASAYAFAALGRDAECHVIAYGCIVADPSAASTVRVTIEAVTFHPASATCAAGVACRDGLCEGTVSCDPASCTSAAGMAGTCCGASCTDLSSDDAHCGSCDIVCGPGTMCRAGRCEMTPSCTGSCSDARLTCCADRCVNLQTDQTACGACDRPCAPDAICVGGTCTASTPPAAVRVRLPAAPAADCGPLLLVLVWIPRDASAGTGPTIGGTADTAASTMPGEASLPLAGLAPPPREALRCGASTDCTVESIALGQLWLVTDANRDGSVSLAELRGFSLLGGIDAGVVWSSQTFGPADMALTSLLTGTGISFPEGVTMGTAAYRRSTDGGDTWVPTTAVDGFDARACTSTPCDALVDDACRSTLPHPFGYLP